MRLFIFLAADPCILSLWSVAGGPISPGGVCHPEWPCGLWAVNHTGTVFLSKRRHVVKNLPRISLQINKCWLDHRHTAVSPLVSFLSVSGLLCCGSGSGGGAAGGFYCPAEWQHLQPWEVVQQTPTNRYINKAEDCLTSTWSPSFRDENKHFNPSAGIHI